MDSLIILLAALTIFSKNVLEKIPQKPHTPAIAVPGGPPPPPPPPPPVAMQAAAPAKTTAPVTSVPKKEKAPTGTPISSLKPAIKAQVDKKIVNLKTDLATFKQKEDAEYFDNEIAQASQSSEELKTIKNEIASEVKKFKEHHSLLGDYLFDQKDALFKELDNTIAALKNYDNMANNALAKLQKTLAPVNEPAGIPAAPPPPPVGFIPPPPPPPPASGPLTGGF